MSVRFIREQEDRTVKVALLYYPWYYNAELMGELDATVPEFDGFQLLVVRSHPGNHLGAFSVVEGTSGHSLAHCNDLKNAAGAFRRRFFTNRAIHSRAVILQNYQEALDRNVERNIGDSIGRLNPEFSSALVPDG